MMGFDSAVAQAEANGDAKLLAQLHVIEPFDPADGADLGVLGEVSEFYRCGDYYTLGLWDEVLGYTMNGDSPFLTMTQIYGYIPGVEPSSAAIERGVFLSDYDVFASFPVSDIPVHFIAGTEDHDTSSELAFEHCEMRAAPAQSFTWIGCAAHMVGIDQAEAWSNAMVGIRNRTLAP